MIPATFRIRLKYAVYQYLFSTGKQSRRDDSIIETIFCSPDQNPERVTEKATFRVKKHDLPSRVWKADRVMKRYDTGYI
jgi:hypothetical protein